jgi:hypothetical protein
MVLVTNSFQFAFSKKAKDGFGRNEGFQNKNDVSGTKK